jgi:hypothetical protein
MRKPKKTQRIFILKYGRKPLSEVLSSKDSARSPLRALIEDEQGNTRAEPIRYSRAHESPFMKDQKDGIDPILDPIVFNDGVLICDVRNDSTLIKFLEVHPKNGVTFEELDHEKDAIAELEVLEQEAMAMNHARTADIEVIEKIVRVMSGKDVSGLTSKEIRRDAMVYAKNSPEEFLSVIDDPDVSRKNIVALAFEMKLLTLRNNDTEVYYNLKDNKSRMLNIPHGEDPKEFIEEYFLTSDGIDAYNLLESRIESLQAQ